MSRALEVQTADQLRYLRRGDFGGGRISTDEFDHILRVCGGLWQHNEDPSAPHAELSAGGCSDGFVDTVRVLKYPHLCMLLGEELGRIYQEWGGADPDWVIGSDHAAATLSFAVAHYLSSTHEFTVKSPEKTQLWQRQTIEPGEVVVQAEELVTTLKTLQLVRQGIVEGNAHPVAFANAVLALVHRSPQFEFVGGPILYFRHYEIQSWKPEECPLCEAGSKRLRSKEHWAELTAG